jgi:hypothetical protein
MRKLLRKLKYYFRKKTFHDKYIVERVQDWSKETGAAMKTQSPYSEEQYFTDIIFYRAHIAIIQKKILILDLDNTYGYGSSFIYKLFSEIFWHFPELKIAIKTDEEPDLFEKFKRTLRFRKVPKEYKEYEKELNENRTYNSFIEPINEVIRKYEKEIETSKAIREDTCPICLQAKKIKTVSTLPKADDTHYCFFCIYKKKTCSSQETLDGHHTRETNYENDFIESTERRILLLKGLLKLLWSRPTEDEINDYVKQM